MEGCCPDSSDAVRDGNDRKGAATGEGHIGDGGDAGGDAVGTGKPFRALDKDGEILVEQDAIDAGVAWVVRVDCNGGK